MQPKPEFVRQAFSSNGLMFLFCVACGKLVAYSPRPDVLTIAESAHRNNCAAIARKAPPSATGGRVEPLEPLS